VTGVDGSVHVAEPEADTRVVSPRAAFWVADVLADPRARAWVFGSGGSLDFPFPVAVKTGTSQSYRDNWTVGFTREVTVGVWVGNFDRRELRNSSGVTGAAPIFHDVLLAAQERVMGRLPAPGDPPLAEPPADLAPVPVCGLSGLRATEACPAVELDWLPGGAHAPACAWHRREHGRIRTSWPARYRSWARGQGLLDDLVEITAEPPALRAAAIRPASSRPLLIVNPPDGAVYLRDPTLRAAFQTLPLRAVADGIGAVLRWQVDGRPLGIASSDAALDWPLERGRHTIVASDGHGREDRATIEVR
jgi:penicillin-binding protein 1C